MTQNPNAVYFSERAAAWEREHPESQARAQATRAIAWMAGVRDGSRVLDLGCGTGVMVPAYEALGAAHVTAIDVARGMVDIAQEKFTGHESVRFLCEDVLSLVTDERFDVAVIYNAYPHFLDPAALARKVASLLVPDGRFLVAHGMSRAAINTHHASVPREICCELEPASHAREPWRAYFDIDVMADNEQFYCFGGVLRKAGR